MLRIYMSIILLLFSSIACVQRKEDGRGQSLGDKKRKGQKTSVDLPSLDKEHPVSIPKPVTGAYLTCLVDDSKIASSSKADVKCALRDRKTQEKVKLSGQFDQTNWLHKLSPDASLKVQSQSAPIGSEYDQIFTLESTASSFNRSALDSFLVVFKGHPIELKNDGYVLAASRGDSLGTMQLPESFPIYLLDGTIDRNPSPESEKRILPTVNFSYPAVDGCYVACYSHSPKQAVYPISSDIFVMGQYRVRGHYEGSSCMPNLADPKGPLGDDKLFKDFCTIYFPEACPNGSCWSGGDTAGWFGVTP